MALVIENGEEYADDETERRNDDDHQVGLIGLLLHDRSLGLNAGFRQLRGFCSNLSHLVE